MHIDREDRVLSNKNMYIILHTNDLEYDFIVGNSKPTSDQDVSLSMPLTDALLDGFSYTESETNTNIVGNRSSLVVAIENGVLSFEHQDALPACDILHLPVYVNDGVACELPSERMLFHFIIAETTNREIVLVMNTNELSARQICADLVEMKMINAVGVSRKTLQDGWYRYANTVFSGGEGLPLPSDSQKHLLLIRPSH